MDKKFLKENNLLKTHEQFMRLCEWSYVPQSLEEEGDDEDAQDNGMPQDMSQMDGNLGGGDANGMDGMQQGADNSMPQDNENMGMDDAPIGNNGAEQGEQGMGADMTPTMDNGMGGDMGMPPMDDSEQEDDTVIDVDDITDAQEEMNDKVNHVGRDLGDVDDKITTLLKSLSKMEQMIDSNNSEIEKFKQEFERRNPTDTEKLNMRSLDSYPYNVNVKEYWKEKSADPNSNYSAYYDNEEPTTKDYEITNNDVDDFSERDIEDSFAIEDDLDQDIKKIFNLH